MARIQYASVVEVRRPDGRWEATLLADSLLLMGQQRFLGSLFGEDLSAGFAPPFAGRGLPHDLSWRSREEGPFELAAYGTVRIVSSTWATWEELSGIDWSAAAGRIDELVQVYEDGSAGPELRGLSPTAWSELPPSARSEPTEARAGSRVFRSVRNVRRDLRAEAGADMLFDAMQTLAGHVGSQNVRWVVMWYLDCDERSGRAARPGPVVHVQRSRSSAASAPQVATGCAAWRTVVLPSGELLLAEQPRPSVPRLLPTVRVLAGPPEFSLRVFAELPFEWWAACTVDGEAVVFASAWEPGGTVSGRLALVRDGHVLSEVRLGCAWGPPVLTARGREVWATWQSGQARGPLEWARLRVEGDELIVEAGGSVEGLGGPIAASPFGVGEGADELLVIGSGLGGPLTCVAVERGGDARSIPGIERGAMDAEVLHCEGATVAVVSFMADYSLPAGSLFTLRPGETTWTRHLVGCGGRMVVGRLGADHVVVLGQRGSATKVMVMRLDLEGTATVTRVLELHVDAWSGVVFGGAEEAVVALADGELIRLRLGMGAAHDDA